jgi:hypothetical protein
VEFLPVGEYIEDYEAAGGAVYDSRAEDFKSVKPKESREIELDIDTAAGVTVSLYSDLPGGAMALCGAFLSGATSGRQKIKLPLTESTAPYSYPIGRLYQLILTGENAFKLYGARLKLREFGTYLNSDEVTGGAVWDSTPLDFGSERLKEYKKLEFDIQTDAPATLTLWTDQPNGGLTQQFTTTLNTGGARQTVKVPLTQGIRGRLLQAEVSGAGVRLFAGRVWVRPMNDPKAQWTWAPLPIEPTKETFEWASFPVNPTPPSGQDAAQWIWGRVLEIEETSNEWKWVDVDVSAS